MNHIQAVSARGFTTLPVQENLGYRLNRLHLLTKHDQAHREETVDMTKGGIGRIKAVSADEWNRALMFQTMEPGMIAYEAGMAITLEASHPSPTDVISGTMTRGGEAGVRISDMMDMAWIERFIADDLFVDEAKVSLASR